VASSTDRLSGISINFYGKNAPYCVVPLYIAILTKVTPPLNEDPLYCSSADRYLQQVPDMKSREVL
jgi:hypothetical protein